MIQIPAGTITLRDDRIKRQWTVEIEPFLLSRFPVTQDLYFEVTGMSPSTFNGERNPVEGVSWMEAIEFCNILSETSGLSSCYLISGDTIVLDPGSNGYRLPTEAEWEYACKAGTRDTRYGKIDEIAWYKKNSDSRTHEVGTKQPNAWGLYDMLGNVWEWCSDVYDEEVYGTYRIIHGGGWNDEERGIMATNRRRSHPKAFKIDDLGFRVARNIR